MAEAVFVLFGYISLSRCALELGSQKTLSGPSGEVAWRNFSAFVRRRRGALGGYVAGLSDILQVRLTLKNDNPRGLEG